MSLGLIDVYKRRKFFYQGIPGWSGFGLVLVWFWSGFGLVWSGWSGFGLVGLVLVWLPGDPLIEELGVLDVESPNSSIRGSPVGLVLVWFWSGFGLVWSGWSGFGLVGLVLVVVVVYRRICF